MLGGPNVAKDETAKICGKLIREILKSYTTGPVWCACSAAKSRLTLCDPKDCSRQAPLSMEFSRQEDWSGLPFPPPGDLPNPGIQPSSLVSPELEGKFFTTELLGSPNIAPGLDRNKHGTSVHLLGSNPKVVCGDGHPLISYVRPELWLINTFPSIHFSCL